MTHQRKELRRRDALLEVLGRDAEFAQVLAREVDAILFQIDRNILPEIRELKSAAHEIGKMLTLRIAIAEQIQHQAADRIRRIARVGREDLVERIEAAEIHVGAKRHQEIGERLARDVVAADRVGQRDEHRMARRARVAEVQLALPLVELAEVVLLVGEVIGHARVRVDRVHRRTHLARHQPRRDGEIFVVRLRQARTILIGGFYVSLIMRV